MQPQPGAVTLTKPWTGPLQELVPLFLDPSKLEGTSKCPAAAWPRPLKGDRSNEKLSCSATTLEPGCMGAPRSVLAQGAEQTPKLAQATGHLHWQRWAGWSGERQLLILLNASPPGPGGSRALYTATLRSHWAVVTLGTRGSRGGTESRSRLQEMWWFREAAGGGAQRRPHVLPLEASVAVDPGGIQRLIPWTDLDFGAGHHPIPLQSVFWQLGDRCYQRPGLLRAGSKRPWCGGCPWSGEGPAARHGVCWERLLGRPRPGEIPGQDAGWCRGYWPAWGRPPGRLLPF